MAFLAFLSLKVMEEGPPQKEDSNPFLPGPLEEEVSALFKGTGPTMEAALKSALTKAEQFTEGIAFAKMPKVGMA